MTNNLNQEVENTTFPESFLNLKKESTNPISNDSPHSTDQRNSKDLRPDQDNKDSQRNL